MTLARRLAAGALAGAISVLAIHPVSRDAMRAPLMPAFPLADPVREEFHRTDPAAQAHLAAAWLDQAAERSLRDRKLEAHDHDRALQLAEIWALEQPNNAFWPMAAMAFDRQDVDWASLLGRTGYNDFQADRWLRWRIALSERQGASPAWHWAWIYTQRSSAIADLVGQSGRAALLSGMGLEDRARLLLAAGRMRDASKSLKSGWVGANLVEGATYPDRLRSQPGNPRALVTARIEFVEALRVQGFTDLADRCEAVLRNNEGWTALVTSADAEENAFLWCMIAVAAAVLPGSVLMASLAGLIALFAAWGVRRARFGSLPTQSLLISLAAIATCAVAWWLTRLALPALAAGLSTSFLLARPPRVRSAPPDRLGPLHELTCFGLGIGFLATFGLFLAGLSFPTQAILPNFGLSSRLYGGSPVFAGLAWLAASQVSLIAGLWSLAQRIPIRLAFAATLEIFGRTVLFGGLALAASLALAGAWADHRAGSTLRMLVENEPANYVYRLQ